jgi:hypothetical protein
MISFHGGLDTAGFDAFLEEDPALALVPFVVAVLETDFLVAVAVVVLFLVVVLVVVLVAFLGAVLALVLGMSSTDEDESAESAETGLEADIVYLKPSNVYVPSYLYLSWRC